jgi:hypothetical protein
LKKFEILKKEWIIIDCGKFILYDKFWIAVNEVGYWRAASFLTKGSNESKVGANPIK